MARKRPQGEGSLNLSMSYKERKPWAETEDKKHLGRQYLNLWF